MVLLTIISIVVEVASLAASVIQLVLLLIKRHESKKNRQQPCTETGDIEFDKVVNASQPLWGSRCFTLKQYTTQIQLSTYNDNGDWKKPKNL